LKLNLRKHRDSTAEAKPDSTYWLKRFLQRSIGYCLTDWFKERLLSICQMAPTFPASVKLLDALQEKADEAEKSKGKVKPH